MSALFTTLAPISVCASGQPLIQDFLASTERAAKELTVSDAHDRLREFSWRYSLLVEHHAFCEDCKALR
jgi:hypothetical protein